MLPLVTYRVTRQTLLATQSIRLLFHSPPKVLRVNGDYFRAPPPNSSTQHTCFLRVGPCTKGRLGLRGIHQGAGNAIEYRQEEDGYESGYIRIGISGFCLNFYIAIGVGPL